MSAAEDPGPEHGAAGGDGRDDAVGERAEQAVDPAAGRVEPRDGEPAWAPAGVASAQDVRRRLAAALRPRATRGQLLAGALCAALGFALVVQLQATQESGLSQLREADLVRAVDDLGDQRQRLTSEYGELVATQRALQAEGDQREEALRSAQRAEEAQALLAGTVPAVGPGVQVRVLDPGGGVTARFLLGTVQELRDAGAEVLSVGGSRVVASTSFTDTASGVEVDGAPLTPPFTVLAIGDPARLEATIGIPGGVLDMLEGEGATVLVQRQDEVRITATVDAPEAVVARPDPDADEGEDGG